MKTPLIDFHDLCTSLEQYEALADKYSYDVCVVSWGPHVPIILNDQTNNSPRIKWVHSITAGVDMYLTVPDFKQAANIPLTNCKGAFSHVLAEFIALGMLYHAKHLEDFISNKNTRKW